MKKTPMKRVRSARWHGVCAGLALAALLVPGQAQRPSTTVRVIVQEQGPDRGLKAQALHLGGRVTKDLSIIHAFAATLPARAVPQIARAQGVR